MDLCRFIVKDRIAACNAIELIGGVQLEYVCRRFPFENVGVNIKLITGKREGLYDAIRQ